MAINLHRLELTDGNIYVSSRGDYYDTPSKTYVIDSRTDQERTSCTCCPTPT